jgi:peroxiredoxin
MTKQNCFHLLCLAFGAVVSGSAASRPIDSSATTVTTPDVSAEAKVAQAAAGAKALEGATPPDWQAERWLNSDPLHVGNLRGKVVLVRWWTAGCRYCRATAPALRGLHERYGTHGLVVVGMYHHKSEEPFDPKIYESTTTEYGFKFPVAFDPEWKSFHEWMRDAQANRVNTGWTSVTFVVDKKGVVRHVHPGGSYVEGDPDYEKLTAVVEKLLSES